jgi:hypothetical protein
MSKLKIALPAALLVGGFLLCTTASYATLDAAKATKKGCTFCHSVKGSVTKENAKELTPAGKYYHEKKTLDGYAEKK